MGGVTALLVSTLAISNPAFGLNTTIGFTGTNTMFTTTQGGQSFINDSLGTGVIINLNTWTFVFGDVANQSTTAATTLRIFNGIGNGGTLVGTSSSTTTGLDPINNRPSVTWTFAGGLAITDTSVYTANLAPTLFYRLNLGAYPNGSFITDGTSPFTGVDTGFQGTFSAVTPVPFEFSPAIGLVSLGALWLAKKKLVNKAK